MKIMCEEDFEVCFRYRDAERCCATCKYCEPDFDGMATCLHPARNDRGYLDDADERPKHSTYNVDNIVYTGVCDAWESKEKKGETK